MDNPPELRVDGQTDRLGASLRRITSSESYDALDVLIVEVEIDEAHPPQHWLEILKPGVRYEATVGGRTLVGDFVRVTVRMGGDRSRRVKAVGLELLHRLRNQRFSAVLEMAKDKVASELIRAAALTPRAQSVSATAAEDLFLDEPALLLLKKLADDRNYALRADGQDLYFAPRSQPSAGPTVQLDWMTEVMDAELVEDISELLTGVTVTGRDYRKPDRALEYKAKATDLRNLSGGPSGLSLRKKALGDLEVVRAAAEACTSASDARERAVAELQRRAETFLRASFRTRARPDLALGQRMEIANAPWPFGGPFLIRAVNHVIFPQSLAETQVEVFSDGLPKS